MNTTLDDIEMTQKQCLEWAMSAKGKGDHSAKDEMINLYNVLQDGKNILINIQKRQRILRLLRDKERLLRDRLRFIIESRNKLVVDIPADAHALIRYKYKEYVKEV